MKLTVTQQHEYSCGFSCLAFIFNLKYENALVLIGRETSMKHGWRPSDLVLELHKNGLKYRNHYVRKQTIHDYPENTIVLLERSEKYPIGHYLVKYKDSWMDSWINLTTNNNLKEAKSGFREKLPGKPMYALIPII